MTADRCAQTAATIAIIGSGPGAVYALAHLLRAPDPLAIDLFEAGPVAGAGMPYDARRNSPAMLANIASVELPPVRQTLLSWLTGLAPAPSTGRRSPRIRTTGTSGLGWHSPVTARP